DAQPLSEAGIAMPHPIAVSRNARRDDAWVERSLMPRLSARKPRCDELDLLVGVAFRELRHHGAGAPARLKLDEARYEVGFAESGERWNLSERDVLGMAARATRRDIATGIAGLCARLDGNEKQGRCNGDAITNHRFLSASMRRQVLTGDCI